MKVCTISDLHGKLPTIQPSDLLIVAGDICPHFCLPSAYGGYVGDIDDVNGQARWLRTVFSDWLDFEVKAKEKVLIFGNHDWVAEKRPQMIPNLRAHILMNEHITLSNGLKVFGSPFSPHFYAWAFNSPPGDQSEPFLDKIWKSIDDDTDIIVVHGPPQGYGDKAPDGVVTGSESLTKRIKEIEPLLVVGGHIHCGYGVRQYQRKDDFGFIVNASVLDERYRLVNEPLYFEVEGKTIKPA